MEWIIGTAALLYLLYVVSKLEDRVEYLEYLEHLIAKGVNNDVR